MTLPHNSRCAESISRRTRRRVCSDKLPSASAIPACGVCSGSVTGPMLPGQPIPAIQPVPARPSAQKCTARALCSAPRVRTADIGRASLPHADHGGAPRAQQLGAGPSDAATGAGDNNDRTTPIHGTRVATRLCCSGLQPHNGETASVRAMRHPHRFSSSPQTWEAVTTPPREPCRNRPPPCCRRRRSAGSTRWTQWARRGRAVRRIDVVGTQQTPWLYEFFDNSLVRWHWFAAASKQLRRGLEWSSPAAAARRLRTRADPNHDALPSLGLSCVQQNRRLPDVGGCCS